MAVEGVSVGTAGMPKLGNIKSLRLGNIKWYEIMVLQFWLYDDRLTVKGGKKGERVDISNLSKP